MEREKKPLKDDMKPSLFNIAWYRTPWQLNTPYMNKGLTTLSSKQN